MAEQRQYSRRTILDKALELATCLTVGCSRERDDNGSSRAAETPLSTAKLHDSYTPESPYGTWIRVPHPMSKRQAQILKVGPEGIWDRTREVKSLEMKQDPVHRNRYETRRRTLSLVSPDVALWPISPYTRTGVSEEKINSLPRISGKWERSNASYDTSITELNIDNRTLEIEIEKNGKTFKNKSNIIEKTKVGNVRILKTEHSSLPIRVVDNNTIALYLSKGHVEFKRR